MLYTNCIVLIFDLDFIKTKFPAETESAVRKAISAKCNDEDKCAARKAHKTVGAADTAMAIDD